MIQTCNLNELEIFTPSENTRKLANDLECSELTAGVLEMLKGSSDLEALREWIKPDFIKQMKGVNLGMAGEEAKKLWDSKSSFGNVLVYGDYDTDGVCSTVLAMEIFRNKAAQVRYFIPRRDTHGYGLNSEMLNKIASIGCNTLVVVDCGTNDSRMLEELKISGVKNIFIFDHHKVSADITIPATVNPYNGGGGDTQKLCATAVLWCWAWNQNIIPHERLKYDLDLVALATIADCMPLHNLNRSLVRYGLHLMRSNPRRGLGALLDCLGINRTQLNEEHLSMRVIPCINAPGRISSADIAVRALLGAGNNEAVYSCVNDLMRTNRKRQLLTENIAREIDTGFTAGEINEKVLFNPNWPVGVLSGVASRICAQYNRPIALAAQVGKGIIRGTLRVPEGGNAFAILEKISDKLDAWGGHKYAAGFSVLAENWDDVSSDLKNMLNSIEISHEDTKPVINIMPSEISISDWRAITELGPFGNDNPSPKFFTPLNLNATEINPLGHENRHSYIKINSAKLLAFGTPVPDVIREINKIKGWVYHPRLDYWQNREQLQFILDYAVT